MSDCVEFWTKEARGWTTWFLWGWRRYWGDNAPNPGSQNRKKGSALPFTSRRGKGKPGGRSWHTRGIWSMTPPPDHAASKKWAAWSDVERAAWIWIYRNGLAWVWLHSDVFQVTPLVMRTEDLFDKWRFIARHYEYEGPNPVLNIEHRTPNRDPKFWTVERHDQVEAFPGLIEAGRKYYDPDFCR